jgi:hypothetical protein
VIAPNAARASFAFARAFCALSLLLPWVSVACVMLLIVIACFLLGPGSSRCLQPR